MMVLAYLGSQSTKFHEVGWKCWFLMSFYLESCIWPDAISRYIRQKNCVKFCANLGKCVTETLTMTRQTFGEGSMSRTCKLQHTETEKGEKGEEQSQQHAHYFLWLEGDCSQRICSWWSKETILHATVNMRICAKISPRTLTKKELAVSSRQRAVQHFLFHKGIFDQKQHDCSRPTFLFPRRNIKLKGSHFYTTEVIEAESQPELNSHRMHKNGRGAGNGA
jgi:hypothetical protein